MYLNVYVPGLQYPAGLVAYVHRQLGLPIASTAPLALISEGFSRAMHRFARDHDVPWVDFVRGQRKDDLAHQYLAGLPSRPGTRVAGWDRPTCPVKAMVASGRVGGPGRCPLVAGGGVATGGSLRGGAARNAS